MRCIVAVTIVLIAAQPVLSQTKADIEPSTKLLRCPLLDAEASEEEQALCWFQRDQSNAAGCEAEKGGVSVCATQTAGWCSKCALDDASVANACFLAYVRTNQFDEARSVERYLQTPTSDVVKCQKSLRAITADFFSSPTGAELLVDGRSYGKMPVKLVLRGEWWKSRAIAKFISGEKTTEIAVSRHVLNDAMDKRTCAMTDIVIRGPVPSSPSEQKEKAAIPISEEPVVESGDQPSGVSVFDVALLSLGGAGLITGGVLLALAGFAASDLESAADQGVMWTPELQNKNDSLEPLSIGGIVALCAGAVLTAVGIVLIASDGEPSLSETPEETSLTVRLTGRELQWAGRF